MPAQGLGIHRETLSHIRRYHPRGSPCKEDFTPSSLIFREVLFPIPLHFGFPSFISQILVSLQAPILVAGLPWNMPHFQVPL